MGPIRGIIEPILEMGEVDLVITSGRWSDKVLAELAVFFQESDNNDSSPVVCGRNPRQGADVR